MMNHDDHGDLDDHDDQQDHDDHDDHESGVVQDNLFKRKKAAFQFTRFKEAI